MAEFKQKQPESSIGMQLYRKREAVGMTISEFAEYCGIGRSMIAVIENGTRPINNNTIQRLVDFFGYDEFGQYFKKEPCRYCGAMFVPNTGKHHFCSRKCARIYHNHRGLLVAGSYVSYVKTGEMSDLAKDNELARKAGLSYGKYRATLRGFCV